ncbi:MAG: hypothetical protein RLN88_04910 [Ekhidna sp.]|uniref:hypothetical protein n=1 Tax=Ekhidna sp. TaxID=2608089 RepID=UPI0032EE37AC
MGGFGVMDFMVKSYRNNRGLLKGGKKSLKKIYEDNNLHYLKKRVEEKTREYDPEKRRIFLEKFHARQKRIQRRLAMLLTIIIGVFSLMIYLILS